MIFIRGPEFPPRKGNFIKRDRKKTVCVGTINAYSSFRSLCFYDRPMVRACSALFYSFSRTHRTRHPVPRARAAMPLKLHESCVEQIDSYVEAELKFATNYVLPCLLFRLYLLFSSVEIYGINVQVSCSWLRVDSSSRTTDSSIHWEESRLGRTIRRDVTYHDSYIDHLQIYIFAK